MYYLSAGDGEFALRDKTQAMWYLGRPVLVEH